MHGERVCRAVLAEGGKARVLMLTAASTIRDRVEGLELGADDYLGKPFEFAELVARVRALAPGASAPLPPVLLRDDHSLAPARHATYRSAPPHLPIPYAFAARQSRP